jgi:hypothetical protein
MSYRILPLPTKVADLARRTGHARGYGHPVQASVAGPDGYGYPEELRGLPLIAQGHLAGSRG